MGYHANPEKSVRESLERIVAKNESLEAELADVKARLLETQQRERAAVDESLIDFIVEHDTDILLAIETKDRAYLETVLKQWRGQGKE